jgi:hypothetical protein
MTDIPSPPDLACWNCGESLDDLPRPISRHAFCPKCFTEVHSCRMCRHYDPLIAHGQCDEERAEPPNNKEVANFCDWYEPRGGAYKAARSERHDSARSRLDALFGADDTAAADAQQVPEDSAPAPEPPSDPIRSKEEEARAKLEALFGKPKEK